MKTLTLSALALMLFGASTVHAHDVHNTNSDHHHPSNVYTHSVSSHYDHHDTHHYNNQSNRGCTGRYCQGSNLTLNTATYYTRSYPVTNTYSYYTTPNTTIHQPPYAYSSCAHNCDQPKRIMVSSKTGNRNYTYRAPSEYHAGHNYLPTPHKITAGCDNRTTTHVSPYKTHKLTSVTCAGCHY